MFFQVLPILAAEFMARVSRTPNNKLLSDKLINLNSVNFFATKLIKKSMKFDPQLLNLENILFDFIDSFKIGANTRPPFRSPKIC